LAKVLAMAETRVLGIKINANERSFIENALTTEKKNYLRGLRIHFRGFIWYSHVVDRSIQRLLTQ
jgi:hypothetical protein